jgi:hypothetical protein
MAAQGRGHATRCSERSNLVCANLTTDDMWPSRDETVSDVKGQDDSSAGTTISTERECARCGYVHHPSVGQERCSECGFVYGKDAVIVPPVRGGDKTYHLLKYGAPLYILLALLIWTGLPSQAGLKWAFSALGLICACVALMTGVKIHIDPNKRDYLILGAEAICWHQRGFKEEMVRWDEIADVYCAPWPFSSIILRYRESNRTISLPPYFWRRGEQGRLILHLLDRVEAAESARSARHAGL